MRNVTFYSGCAAQALRRVTEEQASAGNLTVHDVLVRNVTLPSNPPHIYLKSKPVTLERYIFPITFLTMLQMSSPTKALCYKHSDSFTRPKRLVHVTLCEMHSGSMM